MKKLIFGMMALTSILSLAGEEGYVKLNSVIEDANTVKYQADGNKDETATKGAKSDVFYTSVDFAALLGPKKEFLVFTGGRFGTNFKALIKNYGYVGARYSDEINENLKTTFQVAGILEESTSDDKKASVTKVKDAFKFHTKLKTDSELLDKEAIRIAHDKNTFLLSGIVEGKWGKDFIRLTEIYNSTNFVEGTNWLESKLNFGKDVNQYVRIDGNVVNTLGSETVKTKIVDKRKAKYLGSTNGSMVVKVSNLSPNFVMKFKPSFKLHSTLTIKGEEDLKSLADGKIKGSEAKVESYRRDDLGIETDYEYTVGKTKYGFGFDTKATIVSFKLKDGQELTQIKYIKNSATENNTDKYTIKFNENAGEYELKPIFRVSAEYKDEDESITFKGYNKYINRKQLKVKEIEKNIDKLKTEIDMTRIYTRNILGLDLTYSNKYFNTLKVDAALKYRYSQDFFNLSSKIDDQISNHTIYASVGYDYSNKVDKTTYKSKTYGRLLSNTIPMKSKLETLNLLTLKTENSFESQLRKDLKMTAKLLAGGILQYDNVTKSGSNGINRYNILAISPSLQFNYVKGRYEVETKLATDILKTGKEVLIAENKEHRDDYKLTAVSSATTIVDYTINREFKVGVGLGLEYNYNGIGTDSMKNLYNGLDNIGTGKLKLDGEANKDTVVKTFTDQNVDAKLPYFNANTNQPTVIAVKTIEKHGLTVKPEVHVQMNFLDDNFVIKSKLEANIHSGSNLDSVSEKAKFGLKTYKIKGTLDLSYNW